jgi:hypothetical protein
MNNKSGAVMNKRRSFNDSKSSNAKDDKNVHSSDVDLDDDTELVLEDFDVLEADNLVGQSCCIMCLLKPERAKVTKKLRHKIDKKIFYQVIFNRDNTHDFIQEKEMRRVLLNGNNGTIFPSNGREYIMTSVTDWRMKDGSTLKKNASPSEVQFLVKWNKQRSTWNDYNTSFFSCEVFLNYLKESKMLSYKKFKAHYDDCKAVEWMQYRLCPATAKTAVHLKVTLGNEKQIKVSMDEAIDYFGKAGVEAIAKQHDLMRDRRDLAKVWFHVFTGEEVEIGGKLEPLFVNEDVDHEATFLECGFIWVKLAEGTWINPFAIRTNGTYCVIAAVINCSLLSQISSMQLFNSFKNDHHTTGEVHIPYLLYKIMSYKHPEYTFFYQKSSPGLLSFSEVYQNYSSNEKAEVACICYKTLSATTHAVCWDLQKNRIFDSDVTNEDSFAYERWDEYSVICNNILQSLHTRMDTQCILYVGFWIKRSTCTSRKKRRGKRVFSDR